jgi:hypothetical protein
MSHIHSEQIHALIENDQYLPVQDIAATLNDRHLTVRDVVATLNMSNT